GWRFGTIEVLCVSILIGTSIDYCIHVALSFLDSSATTVQGRLSDCLGLTGMTITGAALTTALSSSMLFFCQVTLFNMVALVMLLNTFIGYFSSVVLFSSGLSAGFKLPPSEAATRRQLQEAIDDVAMVELPSMAIVKECDGNAL
ncbi:hypothetical protein CYMTET_3389, partial [Cymbomonas tetramitiformis]